MKVLAIIPARGGSKGIPRKNIKHLGGKPLLQYTAEKALAALSLSKVILSSEDEEIVKVAKGLDLEVPFKRPVELASDHAKSIDVVQHALSFFEKQNEFFDAVCLLQVTSPFRKKGFIDKAIQRFQSENLDALVSVLPVPDDYNPHWVFEKKDNDYLRIATGEKEIVPRRQNLPKAYHRDGSIYLTRTEIVKKGTFYGERLGFIESEPEFYVNIDTMADWEKAEKMIRK